MAKTTTPTTQRMATWERALSLSTPWPQHRRVRTWFTAVTILGAVFLLLPRPRSWTFTRVFAEDGQLWLTQALDSGWEGVFDAYAGYLHVVPRLVANTCLYVGPDAYVVCTNSSTVLFKVAMMAAVFPVLAAYASRWGWGLFAASLFIFLPVAQLEVLGNTTNLRWFLVVAAFIAIFGNYPGKWLPLFVAILTTLAAVSDPLTLIALPFALWRLWRLTNWWSRLPSIGLVLGLVIHVSQLQPGARGGRGTVADLIDTPTQTIAQLLIRGPLVTQIGMTPTQELLRVVSVPIAVLVVVIPLAIYLLAWRKRSSPDSTLIFSTIMILMGFVVLFVTLSFPASYISIPDIWSPSQPSRYSVITGLFMGIAFVLLYGKVWTLYGWPSLGRLMVVVSIFALAIAFVIDSAGDPRHAAGQTWAEIVQEGRALCALTGENPTFTTTPDYEGWQTALQCGWLR